jgi:hypothetical protein
MQRRSARHCLPLEFEVSPISASDPSSWRAGDHRVNAPQPIACSGVRGDI